jgi:hypothetical protein
MTVVAAQTISVEGASVSFMLSAPNILAVPGEARRQVTAAIKAEIQASNKRLLRAAQAGYPFEPLRSSFVTIEGASLRYDEFAGGIATDDGIFLALEYGTGPEVGGPSYTPPLNRGESGTGIEGWAERHGIDAHVVQRAIARKGTRAWQVVTPVFEREQAVFGANLQKRVSLVLLGLGA